MKRQANPQAVQNAGMLKGREDQCKFGLMDQPAHESPINGESVRMCVAFFCGV